MTTRTPSTVKDLPRTFTNEPSATCRRLVAALRRRAWALNPKGRVDRRFVAPAAGPAQEAFVRFGGRRRFRHGRPTVVILSDPSVRTAVPAWTAQFPRATVHVIAPATTPEWNLEALGARHVLSSDKRTANWLLKIIGPIDVIVDVIPHSIDDQRVLFDRLFWHVKPRGLYVVDPVASANHAFGAGGASWVSDLLNQADDAASVSTRDRELSRAISRIEVSRDLLVIEKSIKHYLKLRDAEANRVLPRREPSIELDVLASLPAGTVSGRAKVTSHESSTPIVALDNQMDYPQLHLRHYRGRVAMVSNQLLFSGSTILPDSFRHSLENSVKNPRIKSVSRDFARIGRHLHPHEVLPGDYYHIDSENSGHFGHLMTEQLSRLWGWQRAKDQLPGLKLVFRIRYPNERYPALEKRFFMAFGVPEEDIVWIDRPMFLDSVIAATPMWHNKTPHYVHPDIKPLIWDPIADALIDKHASTYDKIFASRQSTQKTRKCRNAAHVEDLFRSYGFEVIYPELLDTGTQAAVFANARVVAGFGGSAMFNVLFARNLETLIVLSHESYTARNEHLFASVIGCDTHYFWSAADVAQPETGWSGRAFYSGWEFDFDRNAAELRRLLMEL